MPTINTVRVQSWHIHWSIILLYSDVRPGARRAVQYIYETIYWTWNTVTLGEFFNIN